MKHAICNIRAHLFEKDIIVLSSSVT